MYSYLEGEKGNVSLASLDSVSNIITIITMATDLDMDSFRGFSVLLSGKYFSVTGVFIADYIEIHKLNQRINLIPYIK